VRIWKEERLNKLSLFNALILLKRVFHVSFHCLYRRVTDLHLARTVEPGIFINQIKRQLGIVGPARMEDLEPDPLNPDVLYPHSVVFSADDRYLASGSFALESTCKPNLEVLGTILASGSTGDRSLKVWRVDSDETREWGEFSGHGNYVLTVSFSPDGKRLASGSQDGSVRIWDVITRQDVLTLSFKPSVPTSLTFSADGQRLAVTHFAGVSVFNGSPSNQPLPQ
jgi:hypothetical protein